MSIVINGGLWTVRKKPVEVQAYKINSFNIAEVATWCDGALEWDTAIAGEFVIKIETLEGAVFAKVGDWVIKGVKGEFYPCRDDIFAETYEMVALLVDSGPPDIESYPMQDLFHG